VIDFIQHTQDQAVFGDIGHGIAVMLVAHLAMFIDQHQRRNAPQFEQIDFLAIEIGNNMLRVRQANEGQVLNFPVTDKRLETVRANRQDDCVTRSEGRKILAQARKMGAAIRSKKAAQENQNEVLFSIEVR
jgi:hypothetical protein